MLSLSLEDARIQMAIQVYNKFQDEYYLLESSYSEDKITELQLQIMLLQYNCK